MSIDLAQFEKKEFINVETYRKNGVGVKTPVWFVLEGQTVFVHTQANSGKVKRIRHGAAVQLTPCTATGEPLGEWVPGQARLIQDSKEEKRVEALFNKKYGLPKRLIDLMGWLRRAKTTVLIIQLIDPALDQ